MDQKEKSTLIQNEWLGFNSNIGALYTFFENLSETADKLDNEKKRVLADNLASIFHEKTEEIEKEVFVSFPSIDDLDVFPDFRDDVSAKDVISTLQDNEFKEKMLTWESKHPHTAYKLSRLIFSFFGNPPMSGIILRKSMLITLVTFLEVLIQNLFTNHFLIKGLIRNEASNKADKVMRGNWDKKLNNLSEIGIPTAISTIYRDEILEIVNLRHLLVHNDGVVDEEFLNRSQWSKQVNLSTGKILIVSTKHLQMAINVVFTYGFLLCQSHWRIHENQEKEQNAKIDLFFLDSFEAKRFELILKLSESVKVLDLPEEINQRILVDRAIAFRELHKPNEVESIITKLKSEHHDWQIDIAISTLSKDYNLLQSQLAKAQSKYDIQKIAHWPLFAPIKNEIWFKKAFIKNRRKVNFSNKQRK